MCLFGILFFTLVNSVLFESLNLCNACGLYIYELHSSYHALARGFLALLQGGHRQGVRQIITLDLLNIKK